MDVSEIEAALMRAREAKARAEKEAHLLEVNPSGSASDDLWEVGVYRTAKYDLPALAADVERLAAALREAQEERDELRRMYVEPLEQEDRE